MSEKSFHDAISNTDDIRWHTVCISDKDFETFELPRVEGKMGMRVYRKTKAIDKFRDEMFKAAREMHTVIDLYTAMTIFNNYLDDTEEEFDAYIKYQLMQADYNARLKADMMAMLTELLMDIEECVDGAEGSPQFEQGVTNARVQVVEMIQEKINALKEDKEEKK